MHLRRVTAILFSLLVLFSFSACASRTSEEKLAEIKDRLSLVDEFYESSAPEPTEHSIDIYRSDSFRGIPFGSFRTTVKSREILVLASEYTNAIDYAPTKIFNYYMVPTYWFNSSDQLYSGSYYVSTDKELDDIVSSMTAMLKELYGQAKDINYYDYENNLINLSEGEKIADLVDKREAYYFAKFLYDNIDVELIIERSLSDQSSILYDIIIYYIDDSFDF